MSELTVTVIRLGLLALLWAFVFSVVGVLRGDLYGTRVVSRTREPRGKQGRRAQRDRDQRDERQRGQQEQRRGQAASPPAPRPSRQSRKLRRGPTHVIVTEGSLSGTSVPLSDAGLLIGRNPECALVLSDDFASGRHVRIYRRDDGWYADDLGSTNGTWLDDQRISEGARLEVGSRLRIGQTVLELRK